jgi:DNA-binding transcriptional LysR family regulator
MQLKTLSAFIVLAEELHFGRAAQRCGISQPAMSRLVSDLEADLGVKLLYRTSREVSLTRSGRGFLDSARKAIAYADMAVRAAKAGAVDGIDSLTIGMEIGTEQPLVGQLIAAFRRIHPETRIALHRIDERDLGTALANGEVDVAIAWDMAIPVGLHRHHLGTVSLAVMVQAGHELEQKNPVTWADLAGYPIILPDRDRQPIIYEHYKRCYSAEIGAEPLIAVDVSTMADALAMVAGGAGVGNAPVVPGLQYPGVSILRQEPVIEFSYELVWTHPGPALESLLRCCEL